MRKRNLYYNNLLGGLFMFKFNKSMVGVIKGDVPECQSCGCSPKKNESSAKLSCCTVANSYCNSCNTQVAQSSGENSIEKLQTLDESPHLGSCCEQS